MKISAAFGLSVFLLASTATAYDTTYMAHLHGHETMQMDIDLPEGKSTTEVWGTGNETISCTFIDLGNGNIAYKIKNVKRCVGVVNLDRPTHVSANITNNNNDDLDFKIWVHSTDKHK